MQYCKKTKKTTQYTRLKASQYTKQKRLGLHYNDCTVRRYLPDKASDLANRHVQTMNIILVCN